jgi:hypothetical protein
MYRVIAPRYTTSRTRPVAVHRDSPTSASRGTIAIFSGRTVNAWSLPVIRYAASPTRTFDTPMNPATNAVAGSS